MSASLPPTADVDEVARAVYDSVGQLLRALRGLTASDELSMPETSALARLDRGGPTTSSALARQERISPQSMGATLAGLEARGLLVREPDPRDGRRVVVRISDLGLAELRQRRSARAARVTDVLREQFSAAEVAQLGRVTPLIERLAQHI